MDRTKPFLESVYQISGASEPATRGFVENLRLFGYINEIEYSEMNTILSQDLTLTAVRTDRAETIEMARPLVAGKGWVSKWTTSSLQIHRTKEHGRGQVVCYNCANPQIVDEESVLPKEY